MKMRHKKFQGEIPIPSFTTPSFFSEKDVVSTTARRPSGWSISEADDVTEVASQNIDNGNYNGSYHRLLKSNNNPKRTTNMKSDAIDNTASVTGHHLHENQKIGSDPRSVDRKPCIRDWPVEGITEPSGHCNMDIEPNHVESSTSGNIHGASTASYPLPCTDPLSYSHFQKYPVVIPDLQTLLKIDIALHIHQARNSLTFKSGPRVVGAATTAAGATGDVENPQKVIALDKFLKIVSKATMGGTNTTSVSVQQFATIYIYIASPELVVLQQILQRTHLIFQPIPQERNRLKVLSQLYLQKWKGRQNHADEVYHLWFTLFSPGKPRHQLHNHLAVGTTSVVAMSAAASPLIPQASLVPSYSQHLNHENTHDTGILPRETVNESMMDSRHPPNAAIPTHRLIEPKTPLTNLYLKLAEQLHICMFRRIRNATEGDKKGAKHGNTTHVFEIKRHVPMPLRTVCQYLLKTNSSSKIFLQGQKMNMQYFKNLVREFAKTVPEWIQIVNMTRDEGTSDKSRKKQCPMVVIQDTVSYQSIREKLGARSMRNIIRTTPPLGVVTKDDSNSRKRLRDEVNRHDGSIDHGSNRNDDNDEEEHDNEHCSNKTQRTIQDNVHTPLISTQPTTSVTSAAAAAATTSTTTTVEHGNSKTLTQTNHQSPEIKLRVNHHQCMTEEDYTGGIMIESNSTNPRGLHRLFHKLNAGERI